MTKSAMSDNEALIEVIRQQLMSTDYPVSQYERDFATAIMALLPSPRANDGEAIARTLADRWLDRMQHRWEPGEKEKKVAATWRSFEDDAAAALASLSPVMPAVADEYEQADAARTVKDWQRRLAERDRFIVNHGLWEAFVDTLPHAPAASPAMPEGVEVEREAIAAAIRQGMLYPPEHGSAPWRRSYIQADHVLAALPRREAGAPCVNCRKPVEIGHLVLPWDDVGEMHANCANPFSLAYQSGEGDPEPVLLLGEPMQQVPLAAVLAALRPDGDARGEKEELACPSCFGTGMAKYVEADCPACEGTGVEGGSAAPDAAPKAKDSGEMREALEEIARQNLIAEMGDHQLDGADYEGGYEAIVKIARRALGKEVG